MTCHYRELASASDWSYPEGNLLRPIRNTTQIWVVTRHQYGTFAVVRQTLFRGETSDDAAKCQLFSHINSLSPNIRKQILQTDLYTFL